MVCKHCGTVFCWDNADVTTLNETRKEYCSEQCRKRESVKRRPNPAAEEMRVHGIRGKKEYAGIAEARTGAGEVLLRKGIVLYPYLCRQCGWWHLTGTKPQVRERSLAFADGWAPGMRGLA